MNPTVAQLAYISACHTVKKAELTPEVEQQLQKGESRWISNPLATYNSPIDHYMSSPGKGALMYGAGGAAVGAGLGSLIAPGPGTMIGGAIGGLGGAAVGGLSRYFNNQDIRAIAERSKTKGPLKAYDIEADPTYQARLQRQAMQHAAQTVAASNY